MAYDVAGARSEGYSDQEIAEHLAKERGYDLAGALKEGYKYADIVQHLAGESGAPDQADVQKNFSLEPAIGALAGAGTGTALTVANQGLKLAGRRLGVLPDNKTVSSSASGVADLTPNVLQRPHEVAARVLERAQQNNPFRPQGPSDVINWSSGTRGGSGQYQRGYMGGASQEIEANLQRQADALEARNPGYKVMPGDSSLLLRPADEVDRVVAQRAADVNRYNQTSEARANTAAETRREKLGQYESGRRAAERLKLPGKVTASLPVVGTALGYNAMDLVNRSDADDQIPQQVVSATGALGSAAMPLMNKLPSKLKWLAPAAAFGAPAIDKGLDYIQGSEEVEGNKNGGSISHMKNGGLAQTLKNMFSFGKSKTPFDNFIDPSAVKSRMYHGSPTMTDEVGEGIRSFDPSQGKTGMTFLSPDPKFASSYAGIDGAVYPAFVQAKKPFDYANPAHITDLIKAVPFNPQNKAALNFAKSPEEYASKLAAGRWDNLERPEVIDAVKNLGYDAMYVNEHGVKNLGVFDPKRIKSAIGNRGTYDVTNPDITMADGGQVQGYADGKSVVGAGKAALEAMSDLVKDPAKTVKAYKLFRTNPKEPDSLYPLFVNANEPVSIGKWLEAKAGEMAGDKVKSKLGPLAYRPGWHAGDLPIATHIGSKSNPSLKAPDTRPSNQVWAEVEMPADVDWQSIALERATRNKRGEVIPRTAHITDQVPLGGHYRYKTNPNMTGEWLIGGNMKVNRVLTDDEVRAINEAAGVSDLPRREGFAEGGGLYANIHAKRERIAQGSGEHMRSPGSEGAPTESAFEAAAKKAEGGLMQAFANGGHATAAWQRSEGKNPEGGLNAAGRASYNNETGGNLQPPVSSEAAKSSPKKAKRRKSFCARMEGNSGPMKDESGKPTRKALALRKWDC